MEHYFLYFKSRLFLRFGETIDILISPISSLQPSLLFFFFIEFPVWRVYASLFHVLVPYVTCSESLSAAEKAWVIPWLFSVVLRKVGLYTHLRFTAISTICAGKRQIFRVVQFVVFIDVRFWYH